jgi:hypothetical protein
MQNPIRMAVTQPVKRSIKEGSMQYILMAIYGFLLALGIGVFIIRYKPTPTTPQLQSIVKNTLGAGFKGSQP